MAARFSYTFLAVLISIGAATAAAQNAPEIQFNRDIRPILANTCYACHGPDDNVRKAELRLDLEEAAKSELPSGARAVVPKDPAASELIRRITSDDPDFRMPPADSNKTLSETQIELLRQWIAQGAEWQPHWSFVAPTRTVPTEVSSPSWVRNSVDSFVLARLDREGLEPAKEADKRTLIRRVTLDLTGLPPTVEEVNAFLEDDSANAYEKVVDRLLSSPRYGENMARYWLDLARYADTNGYHIDNERTMWPWRDWVIDAFNDNMPFDRFTVEQLAGDLLPDAARSQQIATGFNRNHMINFEGGAIPEEYLTQYVVDRVNTVGTVWMGLTLGCAQCHDHKFDPVSQKEFYQFYAFFNSVPEEGLDGREGNAAPVIKTPSLEQETKLAAFDESIEQTRAELYADDPELDAAQAAWEREWSEKIQSRWTPLEVVSAAGADPETVFTTLDDGSVLVSGANPEKDVYTIELTGDLREVTALRLEALPDESLSNNGPGRADNANFVLTKFTAELAGPDSTDQPLPLKWTYAKADYEQRDYPVRSAVDSNDSTGWAVDGAKRHERRTAIFVLPRGEFVPNNAVFRVEMRHESQFAQHAVGRFRISATGDPALSPARLDDWYVNGPYAAPDGDSAYKTDHVDVANVDLNETYDDGRLKWVHVRPNYEDGKVHPLSGNVAATYLYRNVYSNGGGTMRVAVTSNDAVKVWLNGEVVHDNNIQRSVTDDRDRFDVSLRPGDNTLVMKVVNYGNEYQFYFQKESEDTGGVPLEIEMLLAAEAHARSDGQRRALREYFRDNHSPEWRERRETLDALLAERKSFEDSIPTAMVMDEMEAPRETFMLIRGQYDQPGEKVSPALPAVFPPLPEDAPRDRLGLARWLVSPEHPLTARVVVNRFWQQYFGAGLVKTAEDFGVQGQWPSHPDLLDWLAVEFIESGWDVKHIQKTIVMSATYRQDSRMTPEKRERDPENRLLARGPRFRMGAETIRDNALAISGLLVDDIGGPSVKPYQPPGIWKEVAYGAEYSAQVFEPDQGDALYRRSMYTFWKRQAPPPNMMLFDAPNRETCTSRRARTNTPLQALALMNDPQFVEAARAFAERLLTEAGSQPEDRIRFAFETALARTPSSRELEILLGIYEDQLERFQNEPEAAGNFVEVGDSAPDNGLDPAELAAWSTVTSLVLNLDETITKI